MEGTYPPPRILVEIVTLFMHSSSNSSKLLYLDYPMNTIDMLPVVDVLANDDLESRVLHV